MDRVSDNIINICICGDGTGEMAVMLGRRIS